MFVDIHCHLDDKAFAKSLPEVIERAAQAGLKVIISNGTGPESNQAVKVICERYSLVRPAYGLYPTEPADSSADSVVFSWIKTEAVTGKLPPVAIGEIGLDGVEPVTNAQRTRFRTACALAQELRLPIIVHSRKAEIDVFEELEAMRHLTPVIMHCFGGSKKLIEEGIRRKYYFSIPAIVKRSEHFQLVAKLVPLSQLFTETDAPYLAADKDVFPNEPSAVVGTLDIIARIKGLTPKECRDVLFMNFQRVFAREV